jgi:peptidyl-prolyl cis-trans isomerase D
VRYDTITFFRRGSPAIRFISREDLFAMLDLIRRKAGHWAVKVLMIVLAISFFIGFGILMSVKSCNGEAPKAFAAIVDGQSISTGEYQTAYARYVERYRNMLGENYDPKIVEQLGLPRQVLDALIREKLLIAEAERLGLTVSDEYLADRIAKNAAFLDQQGRFDIRRYKQLLAANRYTAIEFEQEEKKRLITESLTAMISDSVVITPEEVRNEFVRKNEKVKLALLMFLPSDLIDGIRVRDTEIQQYFDLNRDRFKEPAKRKVRYVTFDPHAFEQSVTVRPETIKAEYDLNIADYSHPERVRASHILFKVDRNADADTAQQIKEKAMSVLERVKAGEDFAALAAEFGEDGTSTKGGDLGFFERGNMVKPFEEAAFGAEPGTLVSELVQTLFGYHIIKVEEHEQAGKVPFEEVKQQLTDKVRMRKGRLAAREEAERILPLLKEGTDLAAVLQNINLTWKNSQYFSRTGLPEEISSPRAFVAAAFGLESEDISAIVTAGDNLYILSLLEEKAAEVPPLAEIRDKVKAQVAETKAQEKAEGLTVKVREKLSRGDDPESIADALGAELKVSEMLTIDDTSVPGVPESENLLAAALLSSKDTTVLADDYNLRGKLAVVVIIERERADLNRLELEQDIISARLKSDQSQPLVSQWLDNLRMKADIEINEDLFIKGEKKRAPLPTPY